MERKYENLSTIQQVSTMDKRNDQDVSNELMDPSMYEELLNGDLSSADLRRSPSKLREFDG